MKTSRQKYFEDYRVEKESTNSKKGYKLVYVYKGEWYSWSEDGAILRKRKVLYIAAALIRTFLLALCGAQRVDLNTVSWVAIPGLISIVSMMYEWIGTVQFCLTKELVQAKECKKIYSFLEKGSIVTALCYCVSTIAGICQLIRNAVDIVSVLVVLGFALCSTISFFVYFRHEKLSYSKKVDAEEDPSLEEN